MENQLLLLTADRLLADPWAGTTQPAAILIDPTLGTVAALGDEALSREAEAATKHHFEGGVLAPALIDCHVHLVLEGDGGVGEVSLSRTDEQLLSTALANADKALRSGVAVLQDQGSRGLVALETRSAGRAEPRLHPEMFVSGPPITAPHGHMWYYGGEASGVQGVRSLARQLVRQGVDLIKVVVSGGGTKGSNEFQASYQVVEVKAAVDVAHEAGLIVTAHAGCIDAIDHAIKAGCDVIHHCNFYTSGDVQEFDAQLANRIAEAGIAVDPTLWVTESLLEGLKPKVADGDPNARAEMERFERHWAGKYADVRGLMAAGVRLVAGSDAGWRFVRFGETWREVVALANFGLPNREAYAAATVYAAEALRIPNQRGSLKKGGQADLLVLSDDPTSDLSCLGHPTAVYQFGQRVT